MKQFIPELDDDEAKTLISFMNERNIPQGSILHGFRFTKDLYFLAAGRIEICNRVKMGNKTLTVHISSIQAPHILGESSFMLDNRENFIIIAATKCSYLELTEKKFDQIKMSHPAIALKILEHAGKQMARRLSELQERIISKMSEKSLSIDLTMQMMTQFIGKTTQCTQELQDKLFEKSEHFQNVITNKKV